MVNCNHSIKMAILLLSTYTEIHKNGLKLIDLNPKFRNSSINSDLVGVLYFNIGIGVGLSAFIN